MPDRGPVLAHALTRVLLVGAVCGVSFGAFPALVAAVSATALVPYEAWSRRRARWSSRCAAVLCAWPIAAVVVAATLWQTVYTAEVLANGGESARLLASVELPAWPADPSYLSAFDMYLGSLPWHRSYGVCESFTILETAALLATVLTLVSFCATFLAGRRGSSLPTERALQMICGGVGAAVIGLAWYQSHTPNSLHGSLILPPTRPEPLALWGYGILVGTACPLAGLMADWLLERRPAPLDPGLRSASLGAARAPG